MSMNEYIELIDKNLEKYMTEGVPESIFKSMKYTVMLPGKRLRPVMCLEACAMFGGNIEDALPCACAIEMLHAQTLIHDDLPCMDNDDYRRGKPSNHKVFTEAIAVLAGDALLTYAPHIITKFSKNLNDKTVLKILNEYFNAAGAFGVIAGQVVDIESEKSSPANPQETLNFIHTHKTADLFKLALRAGALIAGADEKQLNAMSELGQSLGLAFQISDDILDETSTFEEIGKTVGKDKISGKLTYPGLYGIEEAKCKVSCLLKKCYDIIAQNEIHSEIFEEIIIGIRKRVKI